MAATFEHLLGLLVQQVGVHAFLTRFGHPLDGGRVRRRGRRSYPDKEVCMTKLGKVSRDTGDAKWVDITETNGEVWFPF
jgi:hypothetical protein